MITTVRHLADRVGADERTLRRAVEQGTVRSARVSPRRLELSWEEIDYLVEHWDVLKRLREALRTEPNVRLAVLFGSTARGDRTDASDVDVLVDLADDSWARRGGLNRRLERSLDAPVDLVVLGRVRESDPALLERVFTDGRVLVDRGDLWPRLERHRPALRRAARDRDARLEAEAREALQELVSS